MKWVWCAHIQILVDVALNTDKQVLRLDLYFEHLGRATWGGLDVYVHLRVCVCSVRESAFHLWGHQSMEKGQETGEGKVACAKRYGRGMR